MKIEHIALWTRDIEKLKKFYCKYFCATSNQKYTNYSTGFQSYFLTFDDGCRLEIMQINSALDKDQSKQYIGYAHIAFSVGSSDIVKFLTNKLRDNGFVIASEPRTTGDGYFESVVLDPDGNRIEITIWLWYKIPSLHKILISHVHNPFYRGIE